jgi:hypothetical protein
MANNSTKPTERPTEPPSKPPATEAVYEASALADAGWKYFDFPPELVATALKLAKKDKCTLKEAKAIVKAFSERKVE